MARNVLHDTYNNKSGVMSTGPCKNNNDNWMADHLLLDFFTLQDYPLEALRNLQ